MTNIFCPLFIWNSNILYMGYRYTNHVNATMKVKTTTAGVAKTKRQL
jgi:hypothetical protein